MKRNLLVLSALVLTVTAAMAQTATVPVVKAEQAVAVKPAAVLAQPVKAVVDAAQTVTEMVSGKIVTVTLADAAKGVQAQIVVIDAMAKTSVLMIKDGTTIYNAKSEAISLDKLAASDKVLVKYTTVGTAKEAVSVRIVM